MSTQPALVNENIQGIETLEGRTPKPARGRRRKKEFRCHCCKQEKPFCWSCGCGFQICPDCFEENKWGMSNGPTWICPDCERVHMME
jgi:membrane protease subunit (stomatin/prohibitin family)